MPERRIATVLMLDVVDSTRVASDLGDARYRELAARFNRIVRAALKRFGGKEEDHAGDGFFATFQQPDRAIRCAAALADEVRTLGIEIRSGIHTGQTEDQAGKAHGIAVVIGARVMSLAGPGELLVTSTTKELVTGSGFGFEDFSAHELKGVPGSWQVFAVTSVDEKPRTQPLPADEAAQRLGGIRRGTVRERDRRPALVAGAAAGIAALLVVAFLLTRSEPPGPRDTTSAGTTRGFVLQLDAETGTRLASIDAFTSSRGGVGSSAGNLPASNHSMVVGQGGVWIARVPHFLVDVDPIKHEVRSRLILEGGGISFSINVAEGADAIWVSYQYGLIRVNPATLEQELVVHSDSSFTDDVAVGPGHRGMVWLGTGEGRLTRLDPGTRRTREVTGLDPIDGVVLGREGVWTFDVFGATVTRYDPVTMEPVATISLGGGVDALVVGDEKIWALSRSPGTLTPIDPTTNTAGEPLQVGEHPTGIAAGLHAVWVGDQDGSIRRVDEATRQVSVIPFGAEPRAIAVDEDTQTLWIDVA